MAQMLSNLQNIPTTFTHFAPDQVLTSDQLNGVVAYLDDAERLSRVTLTGIGIISGLRVLATSTQATLQKGVAVTSDGDLLYVPSERTFGWFRPYGDAAPDYFPFAPETPRIPAWELRSIGEGDAQAQKLSDFTTRTGVALDDLVVVLLAENWLKDQDVCTGADCDNMGGETFHDVRVILIRKSAVGPFKGGADALPTADAMARSLPDLVVDRLEITDINTVSKLNQRYRELCSTLITRLSAALPALYANCKSILLDLFPSDPSAGWNERLTAINNGITVSTPGIQYYYDFLKDLMETVLAFREQLFGNFAVGCPDVTAFAKHVLLGNLVATGNPDENRTGFYPSPAGSASRNQLDHARFLFQKVHALIANFATPANGQVLRITPSKSEQYGLEERAIPFYYNPKGSVAIHSRWSHALERRGMSAFNYSYNSSSYNAQGAAAAPLKSQLGRFDFFRIEGHLGMQVADASAAIETEIKSKNLPIAVQAVMLGSNLIKIFPWKIPLYSDLHRLHDLSRYMLADQLDDASEYSNVLGGQLTTALTQNLIFGQEAEAARKNVVSKASTVKETADRASNKLRQSYNLFSLSDNGWRIDANTGMQTAGELMASTSQVSKAEFPTAVDSLLQSPSLRWIDWLDKFIQDKTDKHKTGLLFDKYRDTHPGLEHMAGAPRGGTFVLVYDETSGVVVFDFALPYLCCAPSAEEPLPPPPKPPRPIPPWIFEHPITLFNPVDSRIQKTIDVFWASTEPKVKQQIDLQKDYLQLYKDSVSVVGGITRTSGGKYNFGDRLIELHLDELDRKSEIRDVLHGMILDPSVTEADKTLANAELSHVESEIARLANDTAHRVVTQNMDVSAGGAGVAVLTAIDRHVAMLHNPNERGSFRKTVGTLVKQTKNVDMQNLLTRLNKGK